MENLFATHCWFGPLVFAALALFNWHVAASNARHYRSKVHEHWELTGGEVFEPRFAKFIDSGRRVDLRHVIQVVAVSALLVVFWILSPKVLGDDDWASSYLVVLGVVTIGSLPTTNRVLRTFFWYRIVLDGHVSGRIAHHSWVTYRQASHEYGLWSASLMLLGILTKSPMIVGGAMLPFWQAVQSRESSLKLMAKEAKEPDN